MAKAKKCACPKKSQGEKVYRTKRGACYIKHTNGQFRFVAKVGACGKKRAKKSSAKTKLAKTRRAKPCPKGCKAA